MAFSFSNPTATQSQPFGGFSFGGTNTTSTSSLSSNPFPNTSVTSAPMGFGTNLSTKSTPNFFGTNTFGAATTTTSLFPTLGQTTSTLTGGFGQTSAPISSFNFGSTTTAVTSVPESRGLGGIDFQPSTGIDAATGIIKKDKAVKETPIDNELAVLVDSFKKYLKDQKHTREEISRITTKDIEKVSKQANSLRRQLLIATTLLNKQIVSVERLRVENCEEAKNADIVSKTREIPALLQYENSLPSQYFHNLLIRFENQMQSYRQQIEPLEKHLMSLSQPAPITPEELTRVVKHIHDAFVTLAAQLEPVHKLVQQRKEQFLAIRKATGSDMIYDIFDTKRSSIDPVRKPYFQLPLSASKAYTTPVATYTTTNVFAETKPQAFALQNQTIRPPFGNTSFGFSGDTTLAANNQRPFQLQKPPTGNKRGKRWTTN